MAVVACAIHSHGPDLKKGHGRGVKQQETAHHAGGLARPHETWREGPSHWIRNVTNTRASQPFFAQTISNEAQRRQAKKTHTHVVYLNVPIIYTKGSCHGPKSKCSQFTTVLLQDAVQSSAAVGRRALTTWGPQHDC